MKKIGILTSSRADYGIYKSLLSLLSKDPKIELKLIVFGSHLFIKNNPNSLDEILKDNYAEVLKIEGIIRTNSPKGIVNSYGKCMINFSKFWSENSFDMVIAMGDRFEMSAAIQASIPFEIKIAHIHGGETTLGSIDNIYRHQISLASKIHFVSTENYKERLIGILGYKSKIYNFGSLSISDIDIKKVKPWSKVCSEFKIINNPFILVTFHPETVNYENNELHVIELEKVLKKLLSNYYLIITGVNQDTNNKVFSDLYNRIKLQSSDRIHLVETFGKENYFSAMKNCLFLLGNSSSGIIEAASFKKYVINVGKRQKGRITGENIINVKFNADQILLKINNLKSRINKLNFSNIYFKANTSINMLNVINKEL
tara:strand:+ start:3097 stop:4209 length:1113 start_codon:yes stop_codon:yes gene_type:complete